MYVGLVYYAVNDTRVLLKIGGRNVTENYINANYIDVSYRSGEVKKGLKVYAPQ